MMRKGDAASGFVRLMTCQRADLVIHVDKVATLSSVSDITVERRASSEGDVCAYCRAAFEGEARDVTCGCGARLHRECLGLNGGRCTTVGCAGGGEVRAAGPVARGPAGGLARLAHAATWALVAAGVGTELLAGAAGRWVYVALAVVVAPALVVARGASGAWSRARLVTMAVALQAVAFMALDLHAVAELDPSWWRAAPWIGLAATAATVGLGLLLHGRAADVKQGEGARAPSRETALALGLLAALLAFAHRDGHRELLSYSRDRWRLAHGTPDEVGAVLWAVGDHDGPARWAALQALRGLDDADVNATLIGFLRHPDRWLRETAADALTWNEARDPATLRALLEALRDESWPGARAAMIRALAAHTRAFPAEADAVTANHPDPVVRRLAEELLPAR